MAHTLVVEAESDHGVTFRCTECGAVCEFVKEGFGDPNPVSTPDGWVAPDNAEIWMGPCTN